MKVHLQLLFENTTRRDWRKYGALEISQTSEGESLLTRFLRGPDIDDLDTVSQILNLQWREFQQSLEEERQEKDEQKRARISNGIHRLWKRKDSNEVSTLSIGTAQERPVAYEDIEKSVKDAQEHWRSKSRLGGGKPQKYFHGFCSSLDAHSNLLKLLPEQSQYFSIFCGVTHTLIQVLTIP